MNSLRKKVKRSFNIKDKDHEADYSADEADPDSQRHLEREIAEAEKHGWPEGRPGSFLNRLISHGNKKTEEQIRSGNGTIVTAAGQGQEMQKEGGSVMR